MILARLFQSLNLKEMKMFFMWDPTQATDLLFYPEYVHQLYLRIRQKLFEISIHTFSNMGFDNVVPLHGSMENGVEKEAPFDIIFIEGSIETEPKASRQLNENGKLIAIIRPANIKIGKANFF